MIVRMKYPGARNPTVNQMDQAMKKVRKKKAGSGLSPSQFLMEINISNSEKIPASIPSLCSGRE